MLSGCWLLRVVGDVLGPSARRGHLAASRVARVSGCACFTRLLHLPLAITHLPPNPICCSRHYPLYKWAAWWAPAELVKTAELDPAGRYLLGIHPHGVLGSASLLSIGTEALGWSRLFPGIRMSQGKLGRAA